jgi:integrase
MPKRAAHLDRVLAGDEDERLLVALDRVTGGRPHGRLFAELLLYCGLRWSEAAAIAPERVRRRDKLLDVGPVVERDGTIRPYPKSAAGVRTVPVPDRLWPRLLERVLATPPGGLLVPAPAGGVLDYTTWRRRWWMPALERADLERPWPTPHDLRHTYGTRLAEAKVPPHEVMVLLGHESLASVQRYLHAGDDRFRRARKALSPKRTSVKRASRALTPVDNG